MVSIIYISGAKLQNKNEIAKFIFKFNLINDLSSPTVLGVGMELVGVW